MGAKLPMLFGAWWPGTHYVAARALLIANIVARGRNRAHARAWGYTRLPYANKRHLTVWRDFGTATLAQLPPKAVVIAHWEQGMVLQYLVQVEGLRPDVWVDVVEPGDDAWGPRALRRYADRPVFFVGGAGDVATLPVVLVRHDAYTNLYVLQQHMGQVSNLPHIHLIMVK